ncbi:hypothetical protein DENSPDRAFT_868817 [Dentipellis sp. KUC8613]|nr:hypothetical protein DENSPDRAFT_868817 [Dentipellis sp. KUC8613]
MAFVRAVKQRASGSNALDVAASIAKLVSDVTNMLSFPPAAAAASIVLTILQTVQEVKSSQQDCQRLARRTARLLIELGRRMDGRWENAPKALLQNVNEFQTTLVCIQQFMQDMAETKWVNRLLSKSSIENSLAEFNSALEDAARSFQIASLIDIHYAIGSMDSRGTTTISQSYDLIEGSEIDSSYQGNTRLPQRLAITDAPYTDTPLSSPGLITKYEPKPSSALINLNTEKALAISACTAEDTYQQLSQAELDNFLAESTGPEDEYGVFSFSYHQSKVVLRKAVRSNIGWFSDMSHANVDGQNMMVKRYSGPKEQALKQWMRDIKTLRNLYHESIPQLMGYSDGKASTPFILLAPAQVRDINLHMQSVLQTQDLAGCAMAILRMYRDIRSAALYLQQQLDLDDSKAQDFLEHATFTVDSENNVLLGLPKPREGNWVTFRSYNLIETIVDRVIKYLSELERLGNSDSTKIAPELANKLRQLAPLVRALLPDRTSSPLLEPALEALLDEDRPASIPLTALRRVGLRSKRHDQYWRARAPANNSLRIGDFGRLPESNNFEDFTPLGNVFDLDTGSDASAGRCCKLATVKETSGTQARLVGGFTKQEAIRPILVQPRLEGWPLAMMPQSHITVFLWRQARFESVNDAWEYLLENAGAVGERHDIAPHELVLVTRTAVDQNFTVRDWGPPPLLTQHHPQAHQHQLFASHGAFAGPVPTIVYLFTSEDPEMEAYCTDDPMGTPRPREVRSTSWTYNCSSGRPNGHVDYIHLDAEDVANM